MLIKNDDGPSLAMYGTYEWSDWFLKLCKDSREDLLRLLIIKRVVQSLESYIEYECFDSSLWSCERSHDFSHVLDMCTSSE